MPEFTLNRKHNLQGGGHNIRFEKGVPVWVPPELVKAAVACGAEAVSGEKIDPLDDEAVLAVPLTPDEREAKMFEAFKTLISRNDREDFDGAGKPNMLVLKEMVGFAFPKKERDTAFQKFRELEAGE